MWCCQMPQEAHSIVEKFLAADSGFELKFSNKVCICLKGTILIAIACRYTRNLLTQCNQIKACSIVLSVRLFMRLFMHFALNLQHH